MGLIRFLLAAGVVLGHARGWGGIPSAEYAIGFIAPYHAVQAFFVLSGFYMSLTFPSYDGLIWKFYVNRYTRLIVSYWIVASVAVALWFIFPEYPLSEPYLRNLRAADGWWGALVFLSNLTLIGTDSFIYFPQGKDWPQYWAVPQIWSIGTEIWFYLLVPLLVPARLRVLVALICAGIALRLTFLAYGLPFQPWQQKVFPVELPLFLVGILSHRTYSWAMSRKLLTSRTTEWIALGLVAALLSMGNTLGLVPHPLQHESLYNSAAYAIVLFLLMPAIFNLTKSSKLDRLVGEFSYPIYLWHIAIGYYFVPAQQLWQGYFLLLLSVLASLPLVLWVERPMEAWRRKSLNEAKEARRMEWKILKTAPAHNRDRCQRILPGG
jgi:peptidoglycan/LPS O-acetylase OafA/YrhL